MESKVLEDIERRHATIESSKCVGAIEIFTDIHFLVQSLHLAWDHIENMKVANERIMKQHEENFNRAIALSTPRFLSGRTNISDGGS